MTQRSYCSILLGAVSLLAGCAGSPVQLEFPPTHLLERPAGAIPPAGPLRELVGVIHVHTRYSDGTASCADIAATANKLGLDFVIITDHNMLTARREGCEKIWGRTWLLVGNEISTADGHYLTLRVNDEVAEDRPAQQTIDAVRAQGGLGFIAHPFYAPWLFPVPREVHRNWKNWAVTGFTGLEIYDVTEDVLEEGYWLLAAESVLLTRKAFFLAALDRPDAALALWDRLGQERSVVGIAGNDAHGSAGIGPWKIDPYKWIFSFVRVHLLATDTSAQGMYDAIERGHLFSAFDILGDASGFTVTAASPQGTALMGDTVSLAAPWILEARAPQHQHVKLHLYHNGRRIQTVNGAALSHPMTEPGVYRVEATMRDRPWVFANPIYVRAESAAGAP